MSADIRRYSLRIIKAAWGIAIDLRAQAVYSHRKPPGLLDAGKRVLLDVSCVQLSAADIEQLQAGLQSIAAAIETSVAHGYVVIEIHEVKYTPTDYQPEGLAAAMIGWACQEFSLDSPTMEICFDKTNNRYVFSH